MDVDAEAEVEFQLLKFLPGLFVIIARLVMHSLNTTTLICKPNPPLLGSFEFSSKEEDNFE